jgi:hypothetical protein
MHMLDELVSDADADTAALPPETTTPEIKMRRADAFFGLIPSKNIEKATQDADAHPLPPDAAAREIRLQPADAMPGRVPAKDTEKASARQTPPFFMRLLRNVLRAVVIVSLCALAWAAGAYYSVGHSPFGSAGSSQALATQPGAQHDDMVSAMRQMTEEVRALKADASGRNAAQAADQKSQLNSVQAPAGATIADLAGKVDRLDAELTARLSQVTEQLASLEQKISASHATLASRVPLPHKHPKHLLHDAFDPARDPSAPGAPRPLGAQ